MGDATRVSLNETAATLRRVRTRLEGSAGLGDQRGALATLLRDIRSQRELLGRLGLGAVASLADAGEDLVARLDSRGVPANEDTRRRLLLVVESIATALERLPRDGEPTPASVGGTGRRALVVDDSKAMRKLLARTLESLGFAVTEADSGEAGLEMVASAPAPFNVILIDWTLPEMDGVQFVQALRALPSMGLVPVMMVTSESSPDQVKKALEAGVNRYVTKPFTRDKIVGAVERLCATAGGC